MKILGATRRYVKRCGLQAKMSEGTSINLATVGTAELEAMSVPVFASCLDSMSGEAIKRFKKMRKLSASHRSALEKYLIEHPEKRGGDAAPASGKASAASDKGKTPKGVDHRSGFADFKRRLKAWWEGDLLKDAKPAKKDKKKSKKAAKAKPPAPKPAASPAPAPAPVEPPPAVMSKAEILQMLWGEGYALPGGAEFTQKLMQDIKLADGERCLDITAGLGGDACALASRHKVIVEALGSDSDLVEAGRAVIAKAGLNDSVILSDGHAATSPFAGKAYAAIFARENLIAQPDRKKLMANIVPSLRPKGTMIITDFMLADRSANNATLRDWRESEPVKPDPLTVDEYGDLLGENHFAVRDCNDLSEDYIKFIHAGWKRLHSFLQTAKLSPETASMLMAEGNMWLARCKALESGQLRLINMVATLKPVRSMSDSMPVT